MEQADNNHANIPTSFRFKAAMALGCIEAAQDSPCCSTVVPSNDVIHLGLCESKYDSMILNPAAFARIEKATVAKKRKKLIQSNSEAPDSNHMTDHESSKGVSHIHFQNTKSEMFASYMQYTVPDVQLCKSLQMIGTVSAINDNHLH